MECGNGPGHFDESLSNSIGEITLILTWDQGVRPSVVATISWSPMAGFCSSLKGAGWTERSIDVFFFVHAAIREESHHWDFCYLTRAGARWGKEGETGPDFFERLNNVIL